MHPSPVYTMFPLTGPYIPSPLCMYYYNTTSMYIHIVWTMVCIGGGWSNGYTVYYLVSYPCIHRYLLMSVCWSIVQQWEVGQEYKYLLDQWAVVRVSGIVSGISTGPMDMYTTMDYYYWHMIEPVYTYIYIILYYCQLSYGVNILGANNHVLGPYSPITRPSIYGSIH